MIECKGNRNDFMIKISDVQTTNLLFAKTKFQKFSKKLKITNLNVNFRGVKPVDKKEGGGSHNWGTFEDEMKAEEDKANTSDGMNDSAVEADPKEAVDAPAPAAPTKAQEGKNLKDFKFG